MRVLITGICGFVGSRVAQHLLQLDSQIEISGIDNFLRAGSWLNKPVLERLGVKIFYGDIRQRSDLDILPKVDWVIDAAAYPSVLAGVDGKTSSLQLVQNNLFGSVNLLEYCKKTGAGFILLSTSRVYSILQLSSLKMVVYDHAFRPDSEQNFPEGVSVDGINEAYATRAPISLYGATKLSSEQLAMEYGLTYNFPVLINRCGVLAGAGQFGHQAQGIVAFWIHSFKEKRPLKYIGFGGSGFQVRDCLHPKDLTRLLLVQLKERDFKSKPSLVNVSGGVESGFSLAQLSDWCRKKYGYKTVEATDIERPFDIPWMVLDSRLARQVWHWEPLITKSNIFEEISEFADTKADWCEISNVS